MNQTITNWGLYPSIKASVQTPSFEEDIATILKNSSSLARGSGLCYGDAALHTDIISTLRMNKILDFSAAEGWIEVQAGITFESILNFIVPKGFFLPVTPGTKYITAGGAVASDIHGKNHHSEGSFSAHLIAFYLVDKSGQTLLCSKNHNPTLFWETCGGMGLTGVITRIKFHLKRIESSYIKQLSIKSRNLEETFELFEQYSHYTYSVSWLDCLAQGDKLGRSILMVGEHCTAQEVSGKDKLALHPTKKLAIPFFFPNFALNQFSVKAFNFLFYNKQLKKQKEAIVHYDPYFYPLDKILHWNKIYGKKGFLQYQFVLPKTADGKAALRTILEQISKHKQGSFLVVLKEMGQRTSEAVMSFPEEGYTLALDFKINSRIFGLLNDLDKIVESCGGKQYLAKDARMSKEHFNNTYNRKVKPAGFSSLQSQRLEIF